MPLTWAAPGDDGSTGTAASYDVRYSTSAITEGNWASATQATGEPTPSIAGSSESFTVTGLTPSTTYYFAIKTSDEASNTSALSNTPSATTAANQTWSVSTTAQLQNAVTNYASGDTIVLAGGTYAPTGRLYLDNGAVTIRGATGDRDDVVIEGPGMNVDAEPRELFDISSDTIVIEDLTLGDVYWHGIHFRGESGADGLTVRNVRTFDCGERHIKISWGSDEDVIADDILIEDCHMEQTQAVSNHSDNDYIGGIDFMGVNNVTIRDTQANGIVGATGGGRAAIFFWHHATNVVIERNTIFGCDRGVALDRKSVV